MATDNQIFYTQTMTGIVLYLRQELGLVPNHHYAFRRATDNPRTIAVELSINPRYLRPLVGLKEDLSMAAGLDRDRSLRIVRGRAGLLALEIPKPQDLWFNIGVADLPPGRGLSAAVGLNQERLPSTVDFGHALTPHLLIAGTTGSGKTNAEQLLVHNLACYNEPGQVRLILIDVEKRGLRWRAFDRLAHLAHPLVTEEEEAQRVLAWTVAEIDRRRLAHRTTPRLFLFVDELQALVQTAGLSAPITRIAQMGREYGVHFVGAVQNPTRENIGHTDIQRNIPVRLVGRVVGGLAAYVATNQKGSGAEQLTGAGDFLVVQPGQETQRVTIALLTDKDIGRLPRLETQPELSLDGVAAVDRVLDVSQGPGRPPDSFDWPIVGHLVGELALRGSVNPHTARRWVGLGYEKTDRFLKAAEGVLGGLRQHGYDVTQQQRPLG